MWPQVSGTHGNTCTLIHITLQWDICQCLFYPRIFSHNLLGRFHELLPPDTRSKQIYHTYILFKCMVMVTIIQPACVLSHKEISTILFSDMKTCCIAKGDPNFSANALPHMYFTIRIQNMSHRAL